MSVCWPDTRLLSVPEDSVNMAGHKIVLEEEDQQQQQQQPVISLARNRDDLHILLRSGSRSTVVRWSQKELGLLLLFGSLALIVLYAYWDIMMLLTLGGIGNGSRVGHEPLASQLRRQVRVACVVMTAPEYHKSRAVHILRTWGKRCNKIYFMTSARDDQLETIVQNTPNQYELLRGKTMQAFSYLYEHKRDEADWFMKADDDTWVQCVNATIVATNSALSLSLFRSYVFVENLRYMLYAYSPDMPIYFGFKYKLRNAEQKNAVFAC